MPLSLDSGTPPLDVQLLNTAPPFIGRDAELAAIHAQTDAVASGQPRLLFLRGPEGIGKTRLLREFGDRHSSALPQLFTLRCAEQAALPYLPIIDGLLRPLEDTGRLEQLAGADLATARRLLSLEPPMRDASARAGDAETADRERVATLRTLVRLVMGLAVETSCFIVVEDVQWADAETLGWLLALGYAIADRQRAGLRVGVVVTVRTPDEPPPVARVVDELRRETIAEVRDLGPLEPLEAGELLRAIGLGQASQQLVDTLQEAADGSPLFLQSAARWVVTNGALKQEGGHLVSTASANGISLAHVLPASAVSALDNLEPASMRAVVTAALLGDHVDARRLAGILDCPVGDAMQLLAPAVAGGLVRTDGREFRFSSHQIRRACQERAGSSRHATHLEIATHLVTAGPAHDIEVAHHFLEAGSAADDATVIEACRRAGDQSSAMAAWSTAGRFYSSAARLAEEQPEFPLLDLAALHRSAAEAHYRNTDAGPRLQHWARVCELLESDALAADAQTALLRSEAAVGLLRARLAHETPPGVLLDLAPLDAAEGALDNSEEARVLRARMYALRSQAYYHGHRPNEAEASARRALELAGTDEHVVSTQVCMSLGLAYLQALDPDEAIVWFERQREHADELDDDAQRVRSGSRASLALLAAGRTQEATHVAEDTRELASRTEDWADVSLTLVTLAGGAALDGRASELERLSANALVLARRTAYATTRHAIAGLVIATRLRQGAIADARDAITLWLGSAGGGRARIYELLLDAATLDQDAHFLGNRNGAEPSATSDLPRFVAGPPTMDTLAAAAVLVELAAIQEDPEAARTALPVLRVAMDRGQRVVLGWPGLVERLIGSAERLAGETASGERHLRAFLSKREAGQQAETAIATLDLALLLATGPEARSLALEAESALAALDMPARHARAAALAARLEAPVAKRAPRYPGGLSPREVEALQELTRGLTNDEIAEALVISPATARRHIANIYVKLNVSNRAAAARFCVEAGLLEATER